MFKSLVALAASIKISDSRKQQVSNQKPVHVSFMKQYLQGGVDWLQLKSLRFSGVLIISGQLPEDKCFSVLTFHQISQRYFEKNVLIIAVNCSWKRAYHLEKKRNCINLFLLFYL